jgi:FkbM family methyltransferase
MTLRDIVSMLKVFSLSLKLVGRRSVGFIFMVSLLLIKILRKIGIEYFVVPYNKDLRYLVPLNQACDWYHITAELFDFKGTFEPRKGEVVVDVGANVGIYSMYCAHRVGPLGRVIAIEPEAHNFVGLLRNISLNKQSNVTPMNLALANRAGKAKLFLRTSTSHTIKEALAPTNRNNCGNEMPPFIEVPCKTLDGIMSELGVHHIALLNLDVEGAAIIVLEGAENALKEKKVSRIKIETENENQVKSVIEFLEKFSYKAFRGSVSLYSLPNSNTLESVQRNSSQQAPEQRHHVKRICLSYL